MQDIQECSGPLEMLDELNAKGRNKIAVLKSSIERLASIAETELNEKKKTELLLAVDSYKEQLNTSLAAFRRANVVSACVIDKLARENLFSMSEEQQNALRKRHNKQSLTNASNQVTDKLLSISRHLAETTQRSADTLDTLCMCVCICVCVCVCVSYYIIRYNKYHDSMDYHYFSNIFRQSW